MNEIDSSKVMSVEEFLTLSDVKDGITTPTRVEELINLMQKQKDSQVKSADEAIRQHSAIAKAIAETKNTICCDHFVKLGGLWYINGWLNDAINSSSDTTVDFMEDSITLQFRALEKLGISNEMLLSSGLLDIVKNLCDHSSTAIKDKARELLDRWKDIDITLTPKNVENVEKVDAVGYKEEGKAMPKTDESGSSVKLIDTGPDQAKISQNFTEPGKEEGSDCLQLVGAEHIKAEATCSQMTAPVVLDQINLDGGAVSVNVDTRVSISEEVTSGDAIINIDNSLDMRGNIGDEKPGACDDTNNRTVTEEINSSSADSKIAKFTQSLSPQELEGCSSVADIIMAEHTMPETGIQTNIGCKEDLVPKRDEFVDDAEKVSSESNDGMDDLGHQRSLVKACSERTSLTLDGLPENTASKIVVGLNSRGDEDYSKVSAIQNLARDTKSSAMAEMRSGKDFDYGLMDALEVARQVAKAVELDMVNDGSSENLSGASKQPGSPSSSNETDSQSGKVSEESSSKLDSSPQPSTEQKADSSSSEKIHGEPEECVQGVDQPPSLAQEVRANTNEFMCGFDLNQEFPYEIAECSMDINQNMGEENRAIAVQNPSSVPAPSGSGSRSHVDDPLLARSNGWGGSVGTRAFHQLSSNRDADPHDVLPFGLSFTSGKQRQGDLVIDLNIDKEGTDNNVVAIPAKSKNKFDLNMMSDSDDAPTSSSSMLDKQKFSNLKGHSCSSPASSLFPMQPTKYIDLNDGPPMHSISSHPHPFLVGMSSSQNVDFHPFFGTSPYHNVNIQQDANPAISIMGARVEVNRNGYSHGSSLSNGQLENHSMEPNMGAMGSYLGIGPMGSYGQPSHFTYSNTNAGAGPSVSFGSPMFRPGNTLTYMVDPRVGPFPQMASSPSVAPHTYAQPPFFMSMPGPPLGLNGVFPSRPNFDLNLGIMNGGNSQDVASRQLYGNIQGQFIGEHLNPLDSQPSSSLGKRKETETGWETYPYNMKHRYPPGNR